VAESKAQPSVKQDVQQIEADATKIIEAPSMSMVDSLRAVEPIATENPKETARSSPRLSLQRNSLPVDEVLLASPLRNQLSTDTDAIIAPPSSNPTKRQAEDAEGLRKQRRVMFQNEDCYSADLNNLKTKMIKELHTLSVGDLVSIHKDLQQLAATAFGVLTDKINSEVPQVNSPKR